MQEIGVVMLEQGIMPVVKGGKSLADINRINDYLQGRLKKENLESVRAVDAAKWLDEAGLLKDRTEGLPLRNLLREGSIIGSKQENGRWWYIYRVHDRKSLINGNEVTEAFEILLEEIETVISNLNNEGANAFQNNNYKKAKEITDEAIKTTTFRDKVKDIQKQWNLSFSKKEPKISKAKRSFSQRLNKGLRTPEDTFIPFILQALVEMDGSGQMSDVLDKVSEKVKDIINEHDLQPIPSAPDQPRWRNTAQWARHSMVKEGLLSSDSPRGVWEITDEGRKEINKWNQSDLNR